MKMNRRELMGMGVSGAATLSMERLGLVKASAEMQLAGLGMRPSSPDQAGSTRWHASAQRKREMTKDVTWITEEPEIYHLRRGKRLDDEAELYRRMIDPDNIERMADAGVIYGRIFFYKGFGLEYEKAHMVQSKRAADLMHKLGMKVSLYIGGTMFTEAFYQGTPEAENWEARDQWNQWVPYGMQTYRHYACPNEPAYRNYLNRILKIAVVDLGADELAFDNIMLQAEPKSCRCPRCIKAFTAFLRHRYPTPETAKRRFGLPDVGWIRVNQWDSSASPDNLAVLDDPVLQEWVRFRCESLARYAGALNDYVKTLNPNTAVLFNIKGVYSFNRYWKNAVYQPLFAGHMDLMAFDTGGYDEHLDPHTGALISQIRSYKMGRRLNAGCEDYFDDDLRASVHMAFGYQKPVCTPAPFGTGAYNVFTPIMEFFREYNTRYFTEVDNIADVAVLRNWPSMAYSISATYVPATLMEQVLIQYKVPFDLLFEEQIDRLGGYAAVVMAGQECVSDAQASILMKYVKDGGTLIVAGNTAEFNEWREVRKANPLLPARREGKGRIVYIKDIVRADAHTKAPGSDQNDDPEPGATMHKGIQLSPPQWVLPKNHAEIYKTIVASMTAGLSITTDAPLTTVMEILTRPKTSETIIHFINFDRKNELTPFAVTLRKPFSGSVKSITCLSPETNDPTTVKFDQTGQAVKFTVPAMKTYTMIVVAC